MPMLFLMRHARAAKGAPGMTDFDRPLTDSGRGDAQEMGRVLLTRYGRPERVICSAARRTRETLDELGLGHASVTFSQEIFDADDAAPYLAALREADAASVLLVGHNPCVHEAALALAGSGDGMAQGALAAGFPTAAFAVLETSAPLSDLKPGSCFLQAFLAPTAAGAA